MERLEAAADVAGGVEDPRDPPDDRSRAVEQLAGDVVAQAAEAGLVPRRAARLGHERVDGRGLGVVEHGADAAVGRARERELGVLRQPVEDVAQRRGDRQEEQAAGAGRIASACACGVSTTRTPTLAPSSTSAG